MRRAAPLLVAIAAFLALADTGIVALALPPILLELDTTVSGAAAVLGVYAVVLARRPSCLRSGWSDGSARGAPDCRARALRTSASLVCGVTESLPLLLGARGVQAAGGALVLVVAFRRAERGQEAALWRARAVLLGTAAGPALGGALTQAFGWRSIFIVQAALTPLLVVGFLRHGETPPRSRARRAGSPRPRPRR